MWGWGLPTQLLSTQLCLLEDQHEELLVRSHQHLVTGGPQSEEGKLVGGVEVPHHGPRGGGEAGHQLLVLGGGGVVHCRLDRNSLGCVEHHSHHTAVFLHRYLVTRRGRGRDDIKYLDPFYCVLYALGELVNLSFTFPLIVPTQLHGCSWTDWLLQCTIRHFLQKSFSCDAFCKPTFGVVQSAVQTNRKEKRMEH